MSIFEKARELGQEIKETQEFKEIQRTGQNIKDNAEAQQLIQDIQSIQQQLEFAENSGIHPDQELLEQLEDIRLIMENNILIMDYMKAQEDYSRMMQEVNNTVSEEINNY